MNSIQVPDQVDIDVNMHEVQVHVRWQDHDIALPLNVLRQLQTATEYFIERVGGALTPEQIRGQASNESGQGS